MATSGGTARKSSGKRQRYGGKMGVRTKIGKKWVVVMRSSTHGGHSPAWDGFECGQNQPYKKTPGKYRVPAPTKRHHRRGFYRSISDV